MNCPGCAAPMSLLALADRSGIDLEVDVCQNCRALWFDRYENSRLSPGSTLRLFNLMAEQSSASPPLHQPLACPRCRRRLALTHDMQQRGTKFEYWRCVKHGHFITFLQFLKEKDFVRPLTPKQIAELRQNVQTLNCSNCGGPIDLVKQSTCPHCASPLTMIDMKQIAAHVHELQQQESAAASVAESAGAANAVRRAQRACEEAERGAGPPRATEPGCGAEPHFSWMLRIGDQTEVIRRVGREAPDVDRMFADAVAAMGESGSKSLVQAGLGVVIRWFSKE